MANNTFITTSDCERILLDTSILIYMLNPKKFGEPKDTIEAILTSLSNKPTKGNRKRTFIISSVTIMELSWLAKDPALLMPDLAQILGASNVELTAFDDLAAFWLNNNLDHIAKQADKVAIAKALKLNDLSKKQSVEWITRDMMIVASAANSGVDLVLTNDEGVKLICDQVKMFCVRAEKDFWHIQGKAHAEFNTSTILNLPLSPQKK
ncbi:MAG: type II toxin-antitoxin system VapC family toxin [Bacteroidia bacterium]|nr:type II toxin-antitoxin system VapC family toxin [Bacteroidia bacterium]